MQANTWGSCTRKSWFIFACIGLGFYIACTETYRYTALLTTSRNTVESSLIMGVTLALFACIMIPLSKRLQLHSNMLFVGLMTLCVVLKLFFQFTFIATLLPEQIVLFSLQVLRVAELGLFIAFAEFFIMLGISHLIRGFSIALIVAGSVQLMVAFLQYMPAVVLIICIGILTGPFLYISQKKLKDNDSELMDLQKLSEIKTPKITDSLSYKTLLLCFALFPIVFGSIHMNWIPGQDGATVSLLIQTSAACGTILAGNIILLMRRIFEDPESLDFCKNLILPIGIGALYLSIFFGGTLIFAYVIPLNIAQKLTLLLVWAAPLAYATKGSKLETFTIGLVVYNVGRALQVATSVALGQDTDTNVMYTFVIGIVVFTLVIVGGFSFLRTRGVNNKVRNNGTGFQRRFNNACEKLMSEYHLTPREGEVFTLLAKGRTADYIAKTLTFSHSTARTHIMHIYQKTGINSQQKLMDLVESRAEKDAEDDKKAT